MLFTDPAMVQIHDFLNTEEMNEIKRDAKGDIIVILNKAMR